MGSKHSLQHFKVRDSPAEARKKLNEKIINCYFVGYAEQSRGYKFYNHSNKIMFEINIVKFIENILISGENNMHHSIILDKNHLDVTNMQIEPIIDSVEEGSNTSENLL
jgi:uncharacterized protein YpmS